MRISIALLAVCVAVASGAAVDVVTFLSQLALDDVNRATTSQVVLNYQNMASGKDFSHDNAASPLFKTVDDSLLQLPTYAALTSLISQYTLPDASVADPNSDAKTAAASDFIDVLNQTKVFLEGWQYLQSVGLTTPGYDTFKNQLLSLWFTVYARGDAAGSSGFETVFVGEYLDTEVVGLTNWVRFHSMEQTNGVNYHGWFTRQVDVQVQVQFGLEEADGEKQAMESALLLDTSPEFEIMAYSICALTASNPCKFNYAGNEVVLNVLTKSVNGVTVVDQAFPSIGTLTSTTPKTTKAPKVDPVVFQQFVDNIREADVDKPLSTQYLINWGNELGKDPQPSGQKLLSNVDESVFDRPVYAVLTSIYRNNILTADVCVNETDYTTGLKKSMFTAVLDTWGNTTVFSALHDYLASVGEADADINVFKTFLYTFWFGTYTRCSSNSKIWGSSGFEHVFLGESKSGTVDGQHDWMRYYLLEQAGNISYYGWYHYDGQLTGTFEYDWLKDNKKEGGFLFGTSPVFDFSLFTACVLTQSGDDGCRFTLDGYPLAVTSYSQACANGDLCLSTSYPVDEL